MPQNYKSFTVRGADGHPLETVRTAEPVTLYGVAGFAYHRLGNAMTPGGRQEWRISHVETGACAGKGATKEAALDAALTASRSQAGVYAGIRRTKDILQGLLGK